MDHGQIEATNLIDRYLTNRATPEECARFEEHFLDCPDCLSRLESTRGLIDGLKQQPPDTFQRRTWVGFMGWIAAAAVTTFAIFRPPPATPPPVTIPGPTLTARAGPVFTLATVRGAQADAPIVTVSGEFTLALDFEPAPGIKGFAVQVTSGTGEQLMSEVEHPLSASGTIGIGLRSQDLKPGLYRAVVVGKSVDGRELQRVIFPFRFQVP
ncbi:MAG: zf-HC2 domain-containing protein [Acidobacteria bacterium]|nr:zf-HC2 domain-containing protein [Acidobacteriota bacterium]